MAHATAANEEDDAATVAPLTDDQLAVLSTLIYCFGRETPIADGTRLDGVVADIDSGLKDRMAERNARMRDLHAEAMTFAEWFAVVDAVRRDDTLCSLMVDSYAEDKLGARMTLLRDAADRGYAVFAGTSPGEWPDNSRSVYLPDSQQQVRAYNWFTACAHARSYRSLCVCGHSKGGNKAMYLAVRAGELLDCAVSFDGQGFSPEFKAVYHARIERFAPKIRAYALDNDFVNGLIYPITQPAQRIFLKGEHYNAPFTHHAPFSLLCAPAAGSRRLVMRPIGPQGNLGRVSCLFTDYLLTNPTRSELIRICGFLGDAIEVLASTDITESARRARLMELSKSDDMGLTVGYLTAFSQQIGQDLTARDIMSFLFGDNLGETLDLDALSTRAKAKLPEPLQGLFDNPSQHSQPTAERLRSFLETEFKGRLQAKTKDLREK